MKLEQINTKIVPLVHTGEPRNHIQPWAPGDFCMQRDSFGVIMAVDGEQVLVLWSRLPKPSGSSWSQSASQVTKQLAQQIREEEDNEIMRMMQAMAENDQ